MLLHLEVQLLTLLLELVDNFGQSAIVRLLLFLLLALRTIRHGNLPIGFYLSLKFTGHLTHFVLFIFHTLAKVIVVTFHANLFLELNQIAKIVLKFSQLAFNFDVF